MKMHAPVPKEAAFAALMNCLFFQRGKGRDLACLNGFTFNEHLGVYSSNRGVSRSGSVFSGGDYAGVTQK